ncbi:PREDICTED: phospholipase A1-like [Dinoponera quadriceps]|uniref:phospholipase A1 n=1 Tax=Dinoponera quadriceps TaxID=609295 RepID=A0A6P3XXH7_DINQU|nr:PREDICTED: phospholipase A1-like [Dinoponera quadriceps]
MMKMYIALVALVVLLTLPGESHFTPSAFPTYAKRTGPFFGSAQNKTIVAETRRQFNDTALANFTYPTYMNESLSESSSPKNIDCFGLGRTVATYLERLLSSEPNGSAALDVRFSLSSRRQPRRVYVVLDEQFSLEWTDFRIERRTVIIVHGFLSQGNAEWVKDMEKAFLAWDDVNVVVIDWSAGSNTLNYYKAAVNTRIVGYQISKLIEQLANATINANGPDTSNWGPLHLVGHSLGAHICGFAAKELKKRHNKWLVHRITGLDPAQPCFRNTESTVRLSRSDAPFVDVIHTNARFCMSLGLGFPEPIGYVDFYLNGGKMQPGCSKKNQSSSILRILQIPADAIKRAICSHGRSYEYFTESLVSASMPNCTFGAYSWDLTYKHLSQTIGSCANDTCTEMGIRAEFYNKRGTFYVATRGSSPYCINSSDIIDEVRMQLEQDYQDEAED